MHHEFGHETAASSTEVHEAFKQSTEAFYDLPFDSAFIATCMEHGVDPEDDAKPDCWRMAAIISQQKAAENIEQGEDVGQSVIDALVISTPDYVMSNQKVRTDESLSKPEKRELKQQLSAYNGLVRAAAEAFPDMHASELEKVLMNAATLSRGLAPNTTATNIRECVRGAQHELAFGQILKTTGYAVRGTTVKEDLRGIDYVAQDRYGNEYHFDVKASLAKIAGNDANTWHVRTGDGVIKTYSLVTDTQLQDRFFLPEDSPLLRDRTELLRDIIETTPPTQVAA